MIKQLKVKIILEVAEGKPKIKLTFEINPRLHLVAECHQAVNKCRMELEQGKRHLNYKPQGLYEMVIDNYPVDQTITKAIRIADT